MDLKHKSILKMAFLVLEGLDGSGKSTQNRLLREYLDRKGIKYKYVHFPRTGHGIFGELISMFLRGDLGKIEEVNPYLVSLIYAADRDDAKNNILEWLAGGNIVLADRYVMSNVAFQCAKLETEKEKDQLKEWIFQLEYVHYGIPRPDLNIFLDVPFEFTRKNLVMDRMGDERVYLKGGTDIHEADLNFQHKVRQVYLEQAGREENLRLVKCYDEKAGMLGPEVIFREIIGIIEKENFFNL
jgi:dTMP kinase